MFKKKNSTILQSSKVYDSFDFLLIGDTDVGKTCLLNRFCYDFYSSYKKKRKKPEIHKISTINEGLEYKLQFWDVLITEDNIDSNRKVIEKSDGIIFVCSYDNKESLKRIMYWYKLLTPFTDLTSKVITLFVNKNDLDEEIVISENEIKKMSNELNTCYFSMNAKDGKGVKKAFWDIVLRAIANVYKHENPSKYAEIMWNEGKIKENKDKDCIIM